MIFNALHDCPAPSTCPGRIGKAAVCHGGFYVCYENRKKVEILANKIGCTFLHAKALILAGITDMKNLLATEERRVKAIPGIGPKFLETYRILKRNNPNGVGMPSVNSVQESVDTHPDYSESGDLCLVRVAVDTEEFFENRYLKGTILSVDRQDLLGLHHHDPRLLNIFKHIKKPTHNQIAAARSDLGLPDPEGMRPFHLDFQEHTLNRISTYTPPEETIDEYKARTSHLPKLEMIDPDTISENFERYKSQRDGYCKQRTDETITERNQLREETHRILGAL